MRAHVSSQAPDTAASSTRSATRRSRNRHGGSSNARLRREVVCSIGDLTPGAARRQAPRRVSKWRPWGLQPPDIPMSQTGDPSIAAGKRRHATSQPRNMRAGLVASVAEIMNVRTARQFGRGDSATGPIITICNPPSPRRSRQVTRGPGAHRSRRRTRGAGARCDLVYRLRDLAPGLAEMLKINTVRE